MSEKYLIGVDKEGNFVYIEKSKWDCNWYWSGGYVEQGSLDTYEDAERRAEEDDEISYYWQQAIEHNGYTDSLEDFTELWVSEYAERLDTLEEIDDKSYIEWHSHSHFDGEYLKNTKYVDEVFSITKFNRENWWRLRELYKQFYSIRKCAEVFHYGGGQSSVKDEEKRPDLYKELNKHLETVVIKNIEELLSKNELIIEEAVTIYGSLDDYESESRDKQHITEVNKLGVDS